MTREQAFYFFREVVKELDIDKVDEKKYNEWHSEKTSSKSGSGGDDNRLGRKQMQEIM